MATRKKKAAEPIDRSNIAIIPRTQEQAIAALRREVKLFYDFQRLRMQAAGRTQHKPRKDDELIENAPVEELIKNQAADIILHPDDIAALEARSSELEAVEAKTLSDIKGLLEKIPFWVNVLGNREDYPQFKGIGPTIGGVILSQIDIRRANSVSALWRYCGMASVHGWRCSYCHSYIADADMIPVEGGFAQPNGFNGGEHPKAKFPECRMQGKRMLAVDVYYSGRHERPTKGVKLPYNAFVKTKLLGVLGDVLIKCGSDHYRKLYYDYKARKIAQKWGKSDAHRHMAAKRFMCKAVMSDIWKLWRECESLPVKGTYQEDVLKHVHHTNKRV